MLAEALGRTFAALTIDPIHPGDPALARLFGLGRTSLAGVRVDEEKALGYPPFWRGVNLLCNGVSRPKLHIYRRVSADIRERATGHPAYLLLTSKPNKNMSAVTFRRLLQLWALTWGNGCAWIQRNGAGDAIGLWPLMPDRTTAHVVDDAGRPVRGSTADDSRIVYVTDVAGEKLTFDADDVLHIKGLSFNGHVGVPVVEVMRNSLGLGMAAEEYGSRFFGQGATSSGIIMAPPNMKGEQMQEFARAIRQGSEGLGKAHKLMVLSGGTEFKQLSIPPEHAQFLQTREFQTKDVANILGVQSHKLGDSSRTSYASLEQSNQEHLDDDLDPWFTVWEAECSDKLLREEEKIEDSHYVEFNRDALIRMDATAQSTSFATGRQWGYLSVNEIRRMKNMPPVEGGDVYLSPANMVPTTMLGQVTAPPIVEPAPSQPADGGLAAKLIAHERARLTRQVAKAAAVAARKGSKEYAEFLDKIPSWAAEPACIADELSHKATELAALFGAFADPPYTAKSFSAAVIAESERLLAETE